jgi:large subunit ribosomal protein L23
MKVDPRATKSEIRQAVERVFSVKVDAVRTCTFLGKTKRTARGVGRRAGFKKAYVTLAEGSKIDLVEGL